MSWWYFNGGKCIRHSITLATWQIQCHLRDCFVSWFEKKKIENQGIWTQDLTILLDYVDEYFDSKTNFWFTASVYGIFAYVSAYGQSNVIIFRNFLIKILCSSFRMNQNGREQKRTKNCHKARRELRERNQKLFSSLMLQMKSDEFSN